MSTCGPARPDILAFKLVLRQGITHTSTLPLGPGLSGPGWQGWLDDAG